MNRRQIVAIELMKLDLLGLLGGVERDRDLEEAKAYRARPEGAAPMVIIIVVVAALPARAAATMTAGALLVAMA